LFFIFAHFTIGQSERRIVNCAKIKNGSKHVTCCRSSDSASLYNLHKQELFDQEIQEIKINSQEAFDELADIKQENSVTFMENPSEDILQITPDGANETNEVAVK
jgi:hypothetical protein